MRIASTLLICSYLAVKCLSRRDPHSCFVPCGCAGPVCQRCTRYELFHKEAQWL